MSERSHRLDWALLLPASAVLPFDEVIVLGGSDELGQSLVDHGLAARWRRPEGPADRSSFVVAWDDGRLDVEQIGRHVAPGGLLYVEIDRRGRRRLGVRTVERQLVRAGCRVYSAHIVTPDLVRPGRYLPVDHTAALRWHLRTLFVAATPLTRLLRACLAAVLATPLAPGVLRLVTLRYVVIATTTEDRSAPLGVPMARGGERAILVTSGYDQASRAVVLPFQRDDTSPRFAVKAASSPTTAAGTVREHDRLVALHAVLPRRTARALPRPLGMYSVAQRTACVQTCAAGPSMNTIDGLWGRRLKAKQGDLEVVVDWLTEFGAATRVEASTAERDWTLVYREATTLVEPRSYSADFLAAAEQTSRSNQVGECAVHQHYDAGPWNVHIDGAEPLLIDWETDDLRPSDCLGPPMADVLYLVTYWYFLVTRARSEAAEEAALVRLFVTPLPADAGVVAARASIDRALLGLGLERRVVPAVLAALWAERAVYTHRRRAGLGVPLQAGRSRPEAYLRVLAEVAETMCGSDGWWACPVGRTPPCSSA